MTLRCTIDGDDIELAEAAIGEPTHLLVNSKLVDDKPFRTFDAEYISWTASVVGRDGSRRTIDVLKATQPLEHWFYVFVDGSLRFDQSRDGSPLPSLPDFESIDNVPALARVAKLSALLTIVVLVIELIFLVLLTALRFYNRGDLVAPTPGEVLESLKFGAIPVALSPLLLAVVLYERWRLRRWKRARDSKLCTQDAA